MHRQCGSNKYGYRVARMAFWLCSNSKHHGIGETMLLEWHRMGEQPDQRRREEYKVNGLLNGVCAFDIMGDEIFVEKSTAENFTFVFLLVAVHFHCNGWVQIDAHIFSPETLQQRAPEERNKDIAIDCISSRAWHCFCSAGQRGAFFACKHIDWKTNGKTSFLLQFVTSDLVKSHGGFEGMNKLDEKIAND